MAKAKIIESNIVIELVLDQDEAETLFDVIGRITGDRWVTRRKYTSQN